MTDYEIKKFNEIIRHKGLKKHDPLWQEYLRLEYEFLNNQHSLANDPVKIARYNELKKQLKIKESSRAFDMAKEKIKQQIIARDESPDNSVVYAAITNFGKTNE